ncbi:hypothetical protein F4778DRAFT_784718 [Xylariomycetidae sp. FL2044]|nr:hypothetical protein F4778DRAFT_784718 [Xylariomycetidae sp. FL2044]
MSRSRVLPALGLTAVGLGGYYLYSAGGDTKVAQKQAEVDAHKLSSKVKSEIPGRGKEYEKEGEKLGTQIGSKFDSTLDKAQAELKRAEAYAKETKDETMKKVNEFDKKTEAEASKAKSGISSWFSSGK